MKKIFYSVLACTALATTFVACEDQLDIPQKGVITTETFYKTDADCEKALASAYEGFLTNVLARTSIPNGPGIYTPAKVMANSAGDDFCYAGGNYGDHEFHGEINLFRLSTQNEVINFHYTGLYLSVYTCNLVIHYFDRPDATAFMKQAVAEARVLRAYDYFLLANYWGTPPMVTDLLPGDAMPTNSDLDENFKYSQTDIYKWVAAECEAALPNLTTRKGVSDKNGAVRVTTGFANALAGKAYMFAGDYAAGKTALEKVIKSGNYDLVSGERYMDNFHIEGDCNEEKVFEANMEYNSGISDWGGAIQRSTWMEANCFNWRAGNFKANPGKMYSGIDGWGSVGVPLWFGNEFFENDGHSYRFDATLKHIDDAVYDMPYADESLNAMSREEKMASTEVGISDVAQGLYGQSFWLPFKNIVKTTDCLKQDGSGYAHGDNNRLNNIIVMRYAEVLLNYAECCLQTNDATNAKIYINMIQQRAGSKTISETVDMDVLKKEKSYELWFEGCRFQDVLRWNDAEAKARLAKHGHAVPHLFDKLFREPKSDDKNIIWENGAEENSRFYMVHTQEAIEAGFTCGFVEGKHNLFPFPQTVKDKNINLRQNPGWE